MFNSENMFVVLVVTVLIPVVFLLLKKALRFRQNINTVRKSGLTVIPIRKSYPALYSQLLPTKMQSFL